ncbi:lysozyme inhibitor LprI family protein [Acinetobacter calcoaceticus]|uniref:lysozyme inhibitor LprI family protein n=1 Tax=Acinetobacter calcoaceticus TaxID=471 RepID=UPI0018DD7B43|nr:lysozyme inhibitor LprI family protein [Acinetobacter calcoaceticus]
MKILLSLIFTSTISMGVLANCEVYFNDPTDVAKCYEDESYAKVRSNLKKLNEISKEQLSYNPTVLKELSKSQKDWITYRNSYCDTYSNYHGERNNHSNCIVNLNNERTKQLQNDIESN